MARKPRIYISGALYHVIIRGNGGRKIFFSDDDRIDFEGLIKEGIARFSHRIHPYCLIINNVAEQA